MRGYYHSPVDPRRDKSQTTKEVGFAPHTAITKNTQANGIAKVDLNYAQTKKQAPPFDLPQIETDIQAANRQQKDGESYKQDLSQLLGAEPSNERNIQCAEEHH